MCFNFLMVYPAAGILMCTDVGRVSSAPSSAMLGMCLEQDAQASLSTVFGGIGRGGMDMEQLNLITMPFDAPPPDSEVKPYVHPICAARAGVAAADSSASSRMPRVGGGWAHLLVVLVPAVMCLF